MRRITVVSPPQAALVAATGHGTAHTSEAVSTTAAPTGRGGFGTASAPAGTTACPRIGRTVTAAEKRP